MTDSENESTNSVFSFQNVNTTISAKGPNINMSNLNFRNSMKSSMCMPRNFERQRYAGSVYEQRSMYYQRETSPMSIRSAGNMWPRNFQPYYPSTSSRRSMIHGRSGSPMSMRSIDSTASVSAAEIAFAFENVKYNKHDLQLIKHAYCKLMKQCKRKRFEKRRNMKKFLKGSRNRSGYDSGELGSDSSISSEDCRSTKTSTFKENMSKIHFTHIRNERENNMDIDCAENIRPNTFRNKFSIGIGNISSNSQICMNLARNNITQKNRFESGFQLPSQRFSKSIASTTIAENSERHKNIQGNIQSVKNHHYHNNINNVSDDEEIFSDTIQQNIYQKRILCEDDLNLPDNKRTKLSSPVKKISEKTSAVSKKITSSNKNINNFEFAKPMLPAKKFKPKVQETSKAKSSQSLTEFINILNDSPVKNISNKVINTIKNTNSNDDNMNNEFAKHVANDPQDEILILPSMTEKSNDQVHTDQHDTMDSTDVSMRPSFIKRKLFTQKLDVTEKANLSSDGTNSPQSIYSAISKEKNKARKLVTTQSCLNRDVLEDNNLLYLIHKIVPPDHMNATTQNSINQTCKADASNKNNTDNDEWDITSVISMCNDDKVSDTYTDEEIFKPDDNDKIVKNNTNRKNEDKTNINSKVNKEPKVLKDCKIVIHEMADIADLIQQVKNKNNPTSSSLPLNDVKKNKTQNCGNTFWDTDIESDMECTPSRIALKDNQRLGNVTLQPNKEENNESRISTIKNNLTVSDVAKDLNKTRLGSSNKFTKYFQRLNVSNLSVRSHRTAIKKKCCNETCAEEIKTIDNTESKSPTDIRKLSGPQNKNSAPNKPNSQSTKENTQTISNRKKNLIKQRSTSKTRTKHTETEPKPESKKGTLKSKSKPELQNESPKNQNNNNVKEKTKSKSNGPSKVKNGVKPINRNKSLKSNVEAKPKNVKKKKDTQSNANNSASNLIVQKSEEITQNVSLRHDRPLRSCRTSSLNKSFERSTSVNLSNNSTLSKTLRSRVINLSSSIENITFHFKPKPKVAYNKTITQINTSDISFSLGNRNTPTPKKNLGRNRGTRKL